jgi:hypothetical protein
MKPSAFGLVLATSHSLRQSQQSISQFYPATVLLLLLLEELGDGKLLGVCRCLGLPASAKMVVAADARVPWAVLVLLPAAGQLLVALLAATCLPARVQSVSVCLVACSSSPRTRGSCAQSWACWY